MNFLAKNIAYERKKHRFTVRELSEMIGKKGGSIILSWENGTEPGTHSFMQLCSIFGRTAEQMYDVDLEAYDKNNNAGRGVDTNKNAPPSVSTAGAAFLSLDEARARVAAMLHELDYIAKVVAPTGIRTLFYFKNFKKILLS